MANIFQQISRLMLLTDPCPDTEKSYRSHKSQKLSQMLPIFTWMIIVQEIFFMGLSSKFGSYRLTVIQSIPIILILFTLKVKDRIGKQIEILALVISCFAQSVGIVNLYLDFPHFSQVILFIQSYALGIFQQALIILTFRFQLVLLIISFNIVFKTVAALCLGTFNGFDDNLIGIIIPIVLDLIFLFVAYNIEKCDRKTHKELDIFRRKTSSLAKNPILQHLPQSVLILSENAKTCLFINDSFKKNFFLPSLFPDFTFQLALKSLYIDKLNGPNMTEKLTKILEEDDDSASLLSFLNKSHQEDLITQEPLTLLAGQMQPVTNQKWFEVKILKTKFEDQNALLITFTEITYYRSIIMNQEAKQNNEKILATVSHELKTPLHLILTSLRMALQISNNTKAIELISLCIKNSRLLSYTISSIIDYQLAQENKLKPKIGKIELKTLIQEMEFLFQSQCSEKGINLNVKVANQVPQFIYTDKEILYQVLINLIGNAVKFTFSGGITMQIKPDDSLEGNLIFQVEDTGVGIKSQDQSKLFRMSDVSTAESVNTHGAGLGLTISNSLVKALNTKTNQNSITVKSEPGKGSIFSFSVFNNSDPKNNDHSIEEDLMDFLEEIGSPEVESKIHAYSYKAIEPSKIFDGTRSHVSSPIHSLFDQEDFSLIQTKQVSYNLNSSSIKRRRFASDNLTVTGTFRHMNKERSISIVITPPDSGTLKARFGAQLGTLSGWVLIVDDNAFNLMVAKKIVKETGCNVKTAMHGEDAIQKVKKHFEEEEQFFKLIIMDCQMPIMDGYQATKILKEMMTKKEIPTCAIVALTANDSDKDKLKCRECGMDDVLSKPLKEEDMYKVFDYLK